MHLANLISFGVEYYLCFLFKSSSLSLALYVTRVHVNFVFSVTDPYIYIHQRLFYRSQLVSVGNAVTRALAPITLNGPADNTGNRMACFVLRSRGVVINRFWIVER